MSAEGIFRKMNLKRKSEFSKTNRIRLDLFSFEKNEVVEKNKNNCFSFSNKLLENEKQKKFEIKQPIIKQISLNNQKNSNNSLEINEENSSDMSSEGEEF